MPPGPRKRAEEPKPPKALPLPDSRGPGYLAAKKMWDEIEEHLRDPWNPKHLRLPGGTP